MLQHTAIGCHTLLPFYYSEIRFSVLDAHYRHMLEAVGGRKSAHLCQGNFYRFPFSKIFKGHVWTVPGNTQVKYEVSSFNRFKLTGSLHKHRQTDRHISNEHNISATHFVHLAEIKIITIQ